MGAFLRYKTAAVRKLPLCILICILCVSSFAQVAEMVCLLPWGDEAGQMGLINQPELEKCGPLTFCADGSGIFILDSVHQKVVRVEKNEVRTVAEAIGGWAICSDGAGGVFIQEGERITALDAKGQRNSHNLMNRGGKSPKLVEGYGNDLFINADGYLCARAVSQTVYASDAPRVRKQAVEKKSPAAEYIIKRMAKNEVRLIGLDSEGKDIISIPIQLDRGTAGAVLFKGADDAGNLYIEVECLDGAKAGLQVHRYSTQGKRLAVFDMDNKYFTTVYRKTDVSADGSVFQMLTTPEGVRILRFGGAER